MRRKTRGKGERSQINNLSIHLENEKKSKLSPKLTKDRKLKNENKIKSRKTGEKINKTKIQLFGKTKNIDNYYQDFSERDTEKTNYQYQE